MAKKKKGKSSALLAFIATLFAVGAVVAMLGTAVSGETTILGKKYSIDATAIELATQNETDYPATISAFAIALGAILMFFMATFAKLSGAKGGGIILFLGILCAITSAVLMFLTKETFATALAGGNSNLANELKKVIKLGVGSILPGILLALSAFFSAVAGVIKK